MEKNEKKSETLLIGIGGTGCSAVKMIKEQLKNKQMPRMIGLDSDAIEANEAAADAEKEEEE